MGEHMAAYTHYRMMRNPDAGIRGIDAEGFTYELFLKGSGESIEEVTFISDREDESLAGIETFFASLDRKTLREASALVKEQWGKLDDTLFSLADELIASYRIAREGDHSPVIVNNDENGGGKKESRRTILVLSGKGGVGKSTVSLNLAVTLAKKGFKVGLVDVDIHGPSIPVMLNIPRVDVLKGENGIIPLTLPDLYGMKVMSLGFMLEKSDDPVIWRGPLKNQMIAQFLNDVDWGDIDYLIVDNPPGTGDEPLSTAQQLKGKGEAVLVTTPQAVSTSDVSRSINFAKNLNLNIVGLIENMSGFVCPHCHTTTHIFRSGGGAKLSGSYSIPLLGSIPLDPNVGVAGDIGIPYVHRFDSSPVSEIYSAICDQIIKNKGE